MENGIPWEAFGMLCAKLKDINEIAGPLPRTITYRYTVVKKKAHLFYKFILKYYRY